ncbi:MAG: bifunctional hydroxymethylpyrimidine kinase/phosphomethylpyrimidine kinase [Polyangiaceae bacterium]|nr:bifunctional hydroxymethylpyrimidine kinase/phosphomethylpyrimidine kinase [Polyangiaceae bacterium]
MRGRVLVVAGSDSGGGAGIQADIKAITALGAYAATAITALTAQNTRGVFGVHPVPVAFIQQQMDLVFSDLGADAVKTGMLPDADVIDAVAKAIAHARGASNETQLALVVDPVMIAKGGARLMDDRAHATLLSSLVPLATIVTPNVPEAEALTGLKIEGEASLVDAGRALLDRGAHAVLVKGGHLAGPDVVDALVRPGEEPLLIRHRRIDTRHTHGTGCTLASAIATGLAQGSPLSTSVERAIAYVTRAIETAPGFGAGHGPLNHAWPLEERTRA